jgi:hypothetical protein
LTVVVVLPTPPFWFAIAEDAHRHCGAEADAEADQEDAGEPLERAREPAMAPAPGADGVGEGAERQAVAGGDAAIVSAIATKVIDAACCAGSMKSGKEGHVEDDRLSGSAGDQQRLAQVWRGSIAIGDAAPACAKRAACPIHAR